MSWVRTVERKKRRAYYGKSGKYSLSSKLRNEGRTNIEFEGMLSLLSLEEVIALRLELATQSAGGYLYSIPIYKSLHYIVREACLKYAISATRSVQDAARFLGLPEENFYNILNEYEVISFFKGEEQVDQHVEI